MAYVKPELVVENMIQAGVTKSNLGVKDLLIRGFLGGALLGYATTLAFAATQQTGISMVGAVVFPVGFVIIILLGLELVTGSFGLIPLAVMERKATMTGMLRNFGWVIGGHVIGSVFYALLYWAVSTGFGAQAPTGVAEMLIKTAENKTIGYQAMGMAGMGVVLIKAVLCNWMVVLGAVMAMTSTSTTGKIIAMWLPIMTFFGQGFEHAVVNMFVIPAGMMLGADVSFADWWIWNQIPVLIGNFAGGLLFTGLMLYVTHYRTSRGKVEVTQPVRLGADSNLGEQRLGDVRS